MGIDNSGSGELCWRNVAGANNKQLYWRYNSAEQWRHYSQHPNRQPDLQIRLSNGAPSKGFPTAQYLIGKGWKYVSAIDCSETARD